MPLLTLFLIFLFTGMSSQIREDCLCKEIIKHDIEGLEIIPVTTFLTKEKKMLFQITFEDRMGALDMDYIEVIPGGYEIQRKRNGESTINKFNASIPFGWVNMNITVSKHEFHINPYIGKVTSEYLMQHLSIASQYLSACEQGTPSWKISRDKAISVPLHGKGKSQISFTSESDFSPFITIMGLKYYLTNESGMSIGSSGMKLSANSYNFIIEHDTNNVRLLYKKEECGLRILLVSLKLKSTVLNITFGTLDEDFTLVLEPLAHQTRNCETTTEVYNCVGLIILAVIFILLLMITVTILILLKINGPKYAPKFHLEIQSDQHEDTEQMRISCQHDMGTDESHKQQNDKQDETEKLLHSLQNKTTETDGLQKQLEEKSTENYSLQKLLVANTTETDKLQPQLEAKNKENDNLQKLLLANKTKTDELHRQLENSTENLQKQLIAKNKENHNLSQSLRTAKTEKDDLLIQFQAQSQKQENVALQQKTKEIDNGEVYRILHILKIKEDPNYCISIRSDVSDEFNRKVFGNGQNTLNVLLTIMEKFQDDKVVQSAGMQVLSNMKDFFTAIDKDSEHQKRFSKIVLQAFETDVDNHDVTINSSIILREDVFIEKFCTRVFRAAFQHITLNKDPKVVYECLNLLYHLLTKDNTKQSEDVIDECVETVLKTFTVNHGTDININSFCILKVIFIEKEKPKFCNRVASAALHYIDNKSDPKLVSECLKIIHNILIKIDSKQKDGMMNECVERVLNVFEDYITANIIINSCMILTYIISNEKERVKLLDWERMAHAAAKHLENKDLAVVSDSLSFLYLILSQANTDVKKEMVNKHFVEVVKTFLEKNIHSDKAGHLHKTGWEILNHVVCDSERNCEIFVEAKGVDVITLYLQKFHANLDVTEAVLATSAWILKYSVIRKKITATRVLEIFWKALFDCLDTASSWVRTSAAQSICLLGSDDSCKFSLKKELYDKDFNILVECIEENRLELRNRVESKILKSWKGLKYPEPKNFEEIRNYLKEEKTQTYESTKQRTDSSSMSTVDQLTKGFFKLKF